MKDFLQKLPKTSITAIISAIVIYLVTTGYIGEAEAQLISAILVTLGLGVNYSSGKFNLK